jgi:hypothetical protein
MLPTIGPATRSNSKSSRWLLGYLRGSATGYRRGSVSLRRVTGSVRLALTHGIRDEEVSSVLLQHALEWQPECSSVVDTGALRTRNSG